MERLRRRGLRQAGRGATFALVEQLESRVFLSGTALGVHLEGNRDWSRSFMFVDAMKSAREFGSASAPWDGNATLGPDGWPTGDFGAVIITMLQTAGATEPLPDISGT